MWDIHPSEINDVLKSKYELSDITTEQLKVFIKNFKMRITKSMRNENIGGGKRKVACRCRCGIFGDGENTKNGELCDKEQEGGGGK